MLPLGNETDVKLCLLLLLLFWQGPEGQVWHKSHFSKPTFGSVLASNGNEEHHLLVTSLLVYQSSKITRVVLNQQNLFCEHYIFCRRMLLHI